MSLLSRVGDRAGDLILTTHARSGFTSGWRWRMTICRDLCHRCARIVPLTSLDTVI
ncbi:hypothetical protein KCP69_15335 [Salmonella enterica subsp. enterica]|nr:hypothetical protein KCP69_15335 [Salmonella enterica subsp. enterica]